MKAQYSASRRGNKEGHSLCSPNLCGGLGYWMGEYVMRVIYFYYCSDRSNLGKNLFLLREFSELCREGRSVRQLKQPVLRHW